VNDYLYAMQSLNISLPDLLRTSSGNGAENGDRLKDHILPYCIRPTGKVCLGRPPTRNRRGKKQWFS